MRHLVLCVLLLPIAASPQNLYRCAVDGKTTFQDQPCAGASSGANKITIKAAPGPAPAAMAEPQQGSDPNQSMNAWTDKRAREDQRSHIQYQIKQLQQDIEDKQESMQKELDGLAARRQQANNNLAGATYLASLSQQQQAVTQSYALKIQVDQSKIDALNGQLDRLQ